MNILQLKTQQLSTVKWQTSNEKPNAVTSTKIGDFNGDGLLDVVTNIGVDYDATTPDIQIFLANGQGSMTNGTYLLGDAAPTFQTSNISTADINKDGITDIIIAASGGDGDTTNGIFGSKQIIYLSQPTGGFKSITSDEEIYSHAGIISDINRDSYPDVFFTATGIGSSLIAKYEPHTSSINFTKVGLPSKLVDTSRAESWTQVSSVRNQYETGNKYDNTYEVYHNHNVEFLDVDKDGDMDLILFVVARAARVYLNDPLPNGDASFSDDKYFDIDTKLNGLFNFDNTDYILGNGESFYFKNINAGFNPYETIKFDVNGDGWSDIVVNGAYVHDEYILVDNKREQLNNTFGTNAGTLYEVFVSKNSILVNETESRITQIDNIEDYKPDGTHSGFIHNLTAVDLNGDGYLDFLSNSSTSTATNTASWDGETNTAFMLNDGTGRFSRVGVEGLRYGEFTPVPQNGKLGFLSIQLAGGYGSAADGSTVGTFFVTDTPWTLGDGGNNFLYSTSANDSIDGFAGIDTFYANGRMTDFSFMVTERRVISIIDNAGLNGVDTLSNVERIRFDDVKVAIDLDGNAGTAARILGALWGKESIENPAFVGIVLHYLDSGVSYEALVDLALGAILDANKTNEAIVELVFTNLVGEAPTQDVKTELASYMDSGAYSQAGFARAIADLELNATNIDLVGLTSTGLQYTEYVT